MMVLKQSERPCMPATERENASRLAAVEHAGYSIDDLLRITAWRPYRAPTN